MEILQHIKTACHEFEMQQFMHVLLLTNDKALIATSNIVKVDDEHFNYLFESLTSFQFHCDPRHRKDYVLFAIHDRFIIRAKIMSQNTLMIKISRCENYRLYIKLISHIEKIVDKLNTQKRCFAYELRDRKIISNYGGDVIHDEITRESFNKLIDDINEINSELLMKSGAFIEFVTSKENKYIGVIINRHFCEHESRRV